MKRIRLLREPRGYDPLHSEIVWSGEAVVPDEIAALLCAPRCPFDGIVFLKNAPKKGPHYGSTTPGHECPVPGLAEMVEER